MRRRRRLERAEVLEDTANAIGGALSDSKGLNQRLRDLRET